MKNKKMNEFMDSNKAVLGNPIIKSFLENEENYLLVEDAIYKSTEKSRERVEIAFQEHFNRVQVIKYVSKLIHFFSLDYDKKINKIDKRFLLTLDQPLTTGSETETLAKDLIISTNHLSFETAFGSTLVEQIEDEDLHSALKTLTSKQLRILELIYLYNMPFKEVAIRLNTSPQNISNQHKKALKKLQDQLT